ILQYLSPLFIVIGTLAFLRKWPNRIDIISFGIALIGVFLSITKGNIHTLTIPFNSLIWGILSGVTAAFYVVLPRPIVN
ncbi:EamA family transporter, partial [Staphylococcus epidermidis]